MKEQPQIEKDIRRIFKTLMHGTPAEFKVAKKEIEKMESKNYAEFKKHAKIALEYIDKYDTIKNSKNQAAFASGLRLFYLSLGDRYFNKLKNFTLKVIQSPHGDVRESIRKTADWLFVSLSARAFPSDFLSGKELSFKMKKMREEAKKQFHEYVEEIENLIEKYDDTDDAEYVYIDELKPSVHKSLQMLWVDLTRGRLLMLEDNPSEETIAKRKEIEMELANFLMEAESDFDVDDIKNVIYYEQGTDDLYEVIAMFDTGQGAIELQNIIDTLMDAWNYFPHKTLGGKSPQQMFDEHKIDEI